MTTELRLEPEERAALCAAAEAHLDFLGTVIDNAAEVEEAPLRAEYDALLPAFTNIGEALLAAEANDRKRQAE